MAELADDALSGYSAGTDLYLHLSYSGINPKPNGASYTIGTPPAGDPFIARQYRQYYWDAFVQDKNWGVGVSSNSATSNQANIVKNLGYGKLFKLRGDSTIYKILGVTKRRLYNYMGKIRWDEAGVLTTINGILEYPQMWYDGEGQLVNNLHHLGGYYGAPDNKTWGDANTSGAPDHLVNTIDPPDLDGLVRQVNEFTLHTSGDPFLHYTAKHIQHRSITDPLNCRWNYLIKYEVVNDPGTQADGEAFVASNLTDNNSFSNMSASSAERLEFVEEFSTTKENVLTSYPAIFETEPKEDVGLDIYYEASGKKPTNVTSLNVHDLITIGAIMQIGVPGSVADNEGVFVTGITKVDGYPNSWRINLSKPNQADYYSYHGDNNEGTEIRFYNDDGSFAITNLQQVITPGGGAYYISDDGTIYLRESTGATGSIMSSSIIVMMSNKIGLGWFNCWSFGNGVESNRIGDTYNKPYITNGVKASTTLLEDYKEERRKYGLIYSGIYNSTSGVNDLNQFIAAEKITKDINPIYGSIQKLHSRSTADGDLITLCEDRILKILANKDALYNADGNPQLIASNNVLGQAMPFSGEFGISQNPESFASESYRIYFTDKVRGAVMRLSKDGLTPISDRGMKDWFRDNLKLSTKLIGSHDDRNDEYNITLADRKTLGEELVVNGNFETESDWSFQMDGGGAHGISISNGLLTRGSNGGNNSHARQYISIKSGATYELSYSKKWVSGYPYTNFYIDGHTFGTNKQYGGANETSGQFINIVDSFVAGWTGEMLLRLYFISDMEGFIDNVSVREIISDPITVSFKEDVKGWVSFKSFVPENGLSLANDYYTTLGGKLYKHHIEHANRNNFYGVDYNSSVNVLLNDMPGSIKSYHTLDYEGSQSRVEGIKRIDVDKVIYSLPDGTNPSNHPDGTYFYFTYEEFYILLDIIDGSLLTGFAYPVADSTIDVKQYRNGILIKTGPIRIFNHPEGGGIHGRWNPAHSAAGGDWVVGDVITTQLQEDSVNHFNMTPKDGWYVSGIETNKQVGNLPEFIEKEGKWFNYIKGVDSDITSDTDFGAFDIQGLGIIESVDSNSLTISGGLNASLQVGDTIYYEQPSLVLEDNILDVNVFSGITTDLTGSGNDGYTIVNNTTVTWSPTANTPSGLNYFNNLTTENIIVGNTYLGTLEVSNYNGTGTLGFSSSGGVSSSLKLYADGVVSAYFVATTNSKPDFFARDTNSGTMKGSIQKVVPGGMLGFTQIESNQLQKAGVITGINDSVVTIDNSGTLPSQSDYCMFAKNHAINTSSLLGYFADVQFENNSTGKIELFSVGSEVTESSK
jgi:hypothetical protein